MIARMLLMVDSELYLKHFSRTCSYTSHCLTKKLLPPAMNYCYHLRCAQTCIWSCTLSQVTEITQTKPKSLRNTHSVTCICWVILCSAHCRALLQWCAQRVSGKKWGRWAHGGAGFVRAMLLLQWSVSKPRTRLGATGPPAAMVCQVQVANVSYMVV